MNVTITDFKSMKTVVLNLFCKYCLSLTYTKNSTTYFLYYVLLHMQIRKCQSFLENWPTGNKLVQTKISKLFKIFQFRDKKDYIMSNFQ